MLEQATVSRIATKWIKEDCTRAEDTEDVETTRGLDVKFEFQLESMRQEIGKVKTELETSKQEPAPQLKKQAINEEEGWISQKLQFAEIAAQTKDETEKMKWAATFSRELTDTRTQLRIMKQEEAETEDQLDLARVSWNPTTSKEKAKLRAEIQDLK